MTGANDVCSRVGELLPEFLAGRLSETDEKLVREHIEGCRECRNRANAVSLLQQTPLPVPDPGRWDHFVDGVVDAAGGERRVRARRRLWTLAVALVAAAVLVFSWIRVARIDREGDRLDALAREVAALPEAEAAVWTAGLGPSEFMPAGFDASGLSEDDFKQLVKEVGRT